MYIEGKDLYLALERCSDLFPEWKKEGNQFWNSKTGEIITKEGIPMHDLVNRTFKISDANIPSDAVPLSAEDGNDTLLVDPFLVKVEII